MLKTGAKETAANWRDQPSRAGADSHWDSTVRFGRGVVVGQGVRIGPGAVLHDNVRVGDRSIIGSSVVLGEPLHAFYEDSEYRNPPLEVGERCILRVGSVFFAGSTIGPRLETGPYATIRENAQIGSDCRFGNFTDIQGTCRIGDYVRCHSNVTICMHAKIGNYVWMHPYVILLNDPTPPLALELKGPTIEDYAVLAAGCMVFPGVRVGRHAVVGARSELREDIPAHAMAAGSPARVRCEARRFVGCVGGAPIQPYPWPPHRDSGYPWTGGTWRDPCDSARKTAAKSGAEQGAA